MTTPATQFLMLKDGVRTLQYRSAIFAHARDRVVLDLGCGSGILSIFAAQAGARKVYAVERQAVAMLARLMFKANGVEDRVTLIRDDSRKVELPEPVDLIVHEILGSDPLVEGIVPIIDDARTRLLKPGGRLLPERVEICCVGLDALRLPLLGQRIGQEVAQLSRLYGVDLSPVDLALQTWDPSLLLRSETPERALDHIITDETVLWDLDLRRPIAPQIEGSVRTMVKVRQPGRLGGVMVFFRAHLDEQMAVSTSPFAPRTGWDFVTYDLSRVVAVAPGDEVALSARVESDGDWQQVLVDLPQPA